MTWSAPLVTVIMPCYNSQAYIKRTIQSLSNQTYKNIHILCINDGSTDSTLEILDELANSEPRLQIVSKPNQGIEYALKDGIEYLKGDFTFLMGHDDTLSENALELAVSEFNTNSDLDAVRLCLRRLYPDASKNYDQTDDRILTGEQAFLDTVPAWKIHTLCLWRTDIFSRILSVECGGSFNFDELATRSLFLHCKYVGYCAGIYNYYQNETSATNRISIKSTQIVYTDKQIRILLLENNLYEKVALEFEQYALNNIIRSTLLIYKLSPLPTHERRKAFINISSAFAALQKKHTLASFGYPKRIFWSVILSSFSFFLVYIKLHRTLR